MKFIRISFLLMLPFIIEGLMSCCHCIDSLVHSYSNTSLQIQNLDNSGLEPFITNSDTISKDAYGIRLNLQRQEVVWQEKLNFSFIQNSYAFSCRCPPKNVYNPKDSIILFSINSVNIFDSLHQAGSDITSYFLYYDFQKYYSLEDFMKKYNTQISDTSEFNLHIDFLLMTPPSFIGLHKFKINMQLSDGRNFQAESTPINFK